VGRQAIEHFQRVVEQEHQQDRGEKEKAK